jgi:hypothetical protein
MPVSGRSPGAHVSGRGTGPSKTEDAAVAVLATGNASRPPTSEFSTARCSRKLLGFRVCRMQDLLPEPER